MMGNYQVRFLGELAVVIPPAYPAELYGKIGSTVSVFDYLEDTKMKIQLILSIGLMFVCSAGVSNTSVGSNTPYPSCEGDYDDLNEAINALAEKKLLFALEFSTAEEIAALEKRFFSCCEQMIDGGVDVNYADSTGTTPAILAAYFKLKDILHLLEKKGADMHSKDQSGHSASSILEAITKNKKH